MSQASSPVNPLRFAMDQAQRELRGAASLLRGKEVGVTAAIKEVGDAGTKWHDASLDYVAAGGAYHEASTAYIADLEAQLAKVTTERDEISAACTVTTENFKTIAEHRDELVATLSEKNARLINAGLTVFERDKEIKKQGEMIENLRRNLFNSTHGAQGGVNG